MPEDIKTILQKHSYKLTKQRLLVIQLLLKNNIALNAYEITNKINSSQQKINITSVYRTLEIFKSINLVHEVSKGKFILCQELSCTNNNHSHCHFICKQCKKTVEIHINSKFFLSKLEQKLPKTIIHSHTFKLFGLCQKCQKI